MQPHDEREALILAHLEYARHLTREIARDLPPWVVFEELAAAAREGLVQAAERFDPKRGVKFRTYAYYRIRGAVFDHVRATVAESPHHQARIHAQAAVDDLIETSLGSRPSASASPDEAVARAAQSLAELLEEAATAITLGEISAATTPASPAPDAEAAAINAEAGVHLRAAIEGLPPKERSLVEAVYFRAFTIEQAGAALGLTKSWASRLHARALALLREALGDLEEAL